MIIGLGNANADFASDTGGALGLSPSLVELFAESLSDDERAELDRFTRVREAAAEATLTDTIGINPADVMFGVLAAHRDAETLCSTAATAAATTRAS